MKKRITALMLRSASTTNCSPGALLIGCIVVMGFVIYVYRKIVIETLEIMGLVAATALVAGVTWGIYRQVQKQRAKRAVSAPVPVPSLGMDEPVQEDTWTREQKEMHEYAEQLADPDMNLEFLSDENAVRAVRPRTSDGE